MMVRGDTTGGVVLLTVGEGTEVVRLVSPDVVVPDVAEAGKVAELASDLPIGRPKHVQRNQILFCTGDTACRSFLVTTGLFELMHTAPDGEQITIGMALPGELIGLATWWRMGHHPYDAVASVASSALPIEASSFESPCPQLRELCARSSQIRLGGVSAAWRMSRICDSRTRLAFRLTEIAMRFWDGQEPECEIPFRLTQATLGRMCGMRRETVNRLMREFRRDSIVRPGGEGRLVVNIDRVARAYDS